MHTIWKFLVPIDDKFEMYLPEGSQILTIQTQGKSMLGMDIPQMWVLADTSRPKVQRKFRLYGTGPEYQIGDGLIERLKYIATFQQAEGRLVWHVFEDFSVESS